MRNKPWTEAELNMLAGTVSNANLAKEMGRSADCVRQKRYSLFGGMSPGQKEPGVIVEEPTYDADTQRANNEAWKKRYTDLNTKYQRAITENSVVEQLVAEIMSQAPKSYTALPVVSHVRPTTKSKPQSAVLLFSDTHVGKVVLPSQTLGFGRYDFATFLARLKYLEESVISIRSNHTTTAIDELVVAMLGDMLDGALGHGVEAGQRNTLFSQFYLAGHAIAQFLRNIAPHFPKVRVKTVVGNHTRWKDQKKMPTENRFSNLDMFLYALVEALTRDIKSIEWGLNAQPFAIFDVQGFTFHAAHGDHLRGGDKAMGIPNHAIGREISTKTQLFSKYGQQAPHYYVSGHLHRSITLPHALGDVTVNGGFPGLDNYALAENFNPVDATQVLFFVHPKYGKTSEYKLSLKFAEVAKKFPYTLPGEFPIE